MSTENGFGEGVNFGESDGDSLVVDLTGIQEQKFEVLPKGIYSCVIEDCEYQLSKSSGKPMWSLMLSIEDGPYANRKLFTFLSFSERALPMTKGQLNRIAPELASAPFNPKKIAESGHMVGKRCRAKVLIEKYEGEDRNRVRDLLAPATGGDGFLNAA